MTKFRATLPLLTGLLLASASCGDRESSSPPRRIRLFDLMDRATLEAPPATNSSAARETLVAFDFDAESPKRVRLALGEEASDVRTPAAGEVAVVQRKGVVGAALSVGPLTAGTAGSAVFTFPAQGFALYEITGRTKLESNAQEGAASTREALRVLEHGSDVDDPANVPSGLRRQALTHRVSRRIDPSGWDTFSVTFVTRAGTRALELQLRHRDDGSGASITRFDDVTVHCKHLVDADLWEHLRTVYAPRDGQEASTPWRIRASLPRNIVQEEEVRDAVLLPPPSRLSFPVTLPPRETEPRLRFQYGMLPEAFAAPGDGARIVVRFESDEGERTTVGAVDFDPKGNEAERTWLSAEFDLTAQSGRSGILSFESRDVEGSAADSIDAVILGTPRIEPRTESASIHNVLLIGVDTLRADRLSALGYGRPTTPNLERLAAAGIRFRNVRSQAPWTLPSFASILTSLYPSAHGAGRGGDKEWTAIDPGTVSIAELLARAGYETQGIVANRMLAPKYGLDQGFEGYRSRWTLESADADVGAVCEFVDRHRTTPWLLFWHIMDPHLPYTTEARFHDAFTDKGYVGRFSARKSVPFEALVGNQRGGRGAHEGAPPMPDLSDADRQYVSDAYDAEIAETDAAIGKVLDALIASRQWENTIVAFVADHGEGLGDHDHYHHGYTLYDDQVRIPMLLRIPGRHEGRVVETAVASIDLVPTLLRALGMEPPADFQGRDLAGDDFAKSRPYFIESPTYDSSGQKAWVEGSFKFVQDPVFRTEALFDLTNDPGEITNVSAKHLNVVTRARADLAEFRWRQLQRGRYHLRVVGRPGQLLTISIRTDDVFDANYATRPATTDRDVRMDLERKNLTLETFLVSERLELVFWCRGRRLDLDVRLDGRSLEGGLLLGNTEQPRSLPLVLSLDLDEVPSLPAESAQAPTRHQARLWVDAGFTSTLPEVPSPEEMEILKQLGYAR